jgi:predicted acetyltransferase
MRGEGMDMRLVFPDITYKEKSEEYIQEFYDHGSEINGSGALDRFLKESTYEEWLEKILGDIDIANIPEPRVPSLTYFYVREEDDRIVGMINIRLALNDFLRKEGGHIGYSVRPTERRKHYATDMLNAGLKVCDKLGIKKVLVSCDKENPASAGVIKNCGGVLKEEFYSENFEETIQMYVIKR